MSNNNFNFSQLGYSHEELEFLLGKIEKGFVLSEKDYKMLKDLGIENLSTFSGKYEDLKNIPDIVLQVQSVMEQLDIETKENSSNKIKTVSDAIMKEIAKVENNADKKIEFAKNNLSNELDKTKNELSSSIRDIEYVIEDSIEIAMDEMSEKLNIAEQKINNNASSINALERNLNEVPNDLKLLENRIDDVELDLANLIASILASSRLYK